MRAKNSANVLEILILKYSSRGPFLETPDNFPGPKTILGVQYAPTAIQFLLILKAKF